MGVAVLVFMWLALRYKYIDDEEAAQGDKQEKIGSLQAENENHYTKEMATIDENKTEDSSSSEDKGKNNTCVTEL